MIDLTKEFIGKKVLIERSKMTPKLVSSTLILDEPNQVVMGYEPVISNGKTVGFVTSAGYSYSLGRGIVTALLAPEVLGNHTELSIEYFGQTLSATVLNKPKVLTY